MSFRTYSSTTTNVNRDADSSTILENPFNKNLTATLKNLIIIDNTYLNNVSISGSVDIFGPIQFFNDIYLDGNLNQDGDYNLLGSINQTGGNYTLFGSLNQTGNHNLIGSLNQTGNHNLIGSLNQTGNHTLYGSINQTGGNYTLFGSLNQTGNYNLIGSLNQTGNYNLIGSLNQTGNYNLIGSLNQTGNYNLIGSLNQTGNYNLIGSLNQTGNYNLIGSLNQTGNYNLIGSLNQTGIINLVGQISMVYSGSNNSVCITNTLGSQSGNNNVILGNYIYDKVSYSITDVISIGLETRQNGGDDTNSIFIGNRIGKLNTIAINDATMIGHNILQDCNTSADFDKSIFIGNNILDGYLGTSVTKNMMIGTNILGTTTSNILTENMIIGSDSFDSFISSTSDFLSNVCIGHNICSNVTSLFGSGDTSYNTLIGNNIFDQMNFSLSNINDFTANTLVGYSICGLNNTLNGYRDMRYNTIIGDRSCYFNSSLTGINRNTFIGEACCFNNSSLTYSENTVIVGSGSIISSTNVSSLINCTFLGTLSNTTNTVLGSATNRIAIGANSLVTSDHSCVLGVTGDSSIQQTKVGIGITNPTASLHIKGSLNPSDILYYYFQVENPSYPNRYLVSIKPDGMYFDQVNLSTSSYNTPLRVNMQTSSTTYSFQLYQDVTPVAEFFNNVTIYLSRIANVATLTIPYYTNTISNIGNTLKLTTLLPSEFRPIASVSSLIKADLYSIIPSDDYRQGNCEVTSGGELNIFSIPNSSINMSPFQIFGFSMSWQCTSL